ncbi:MAG TPA: hypothetical protein VN605_04395 [Thermoanaerobaculia bacterium]|nr:hypothetical protein [Thermoanaerobaculia bacterium]
MLAIALAAAAAAALALEWHLPPPTARSIEVHVVHGEVEVRSSADAQVHVYATRTSAHDDPAAVRMQMTETAKGLLLIDRYPDRGVADTNECLPPPDPEHGDIWRMHVDVHVIVEVPDGVRVEWRRYGE